ncbi:ABC transporter substrate-binding protein [Mameliella sediminis]|uniref:ABC transporter substrate-binding protein n=1 Tax=Mameliella sediminis TaxID=2836866 RepID=UPI001C48C1C0|nr:ABC transporter substrate-binding protein [Mameliella sediminis]MBV7395924.1 ABC transporter substrate-binding protein [Mameliella sediminis]
MKPTTAALTSLAILTGATAQSAEPVTFALNWLPVAEHGGFYQAQLDGTYAACGLDVSIIPGGPQVNNRALMLAGRVDFHMGSDLLAAFNAAAEDIPVVAVAAIFQKTPQILMTHPGKADGFEGLKDMTILVDDNAYATYYRWMINKFGFSAEQRQPYTYNAAPFLADDGKVMQGYLTSEPYLIETEGGFKPDVYLLADHGFDSFATTIETMRGTLEKHPDTVKCFVEGSITGWYNYLWGDNSAANAEIKRLNPEFTQDKIDFAISQMKTYEILTAGDAATLGIGAIPLDKAEGFFRSMVEAGVLDEGLDWASAIDVTYVNKGHGTDLVSQ